jgi:hypothetical protein
LKTEVSARGPRLLVLCLGLLLILWLVVLPWISTRPAVRQWSDFLDANGVNPNAKFFTDQQAGFVSSRQVMQQMSKHPETFWNIRRTSPPAASE